MRFTRRSTLGLLGAGLATSAMPALVRAQQQELKVGFIAPLSGPWAYPGTQCLKGAELAVEDINAAGGIKALGGAKLKLVVEDGGDNVERVKNAAQRLIAGNPDLVAGVGAWLSSFSLAATEVSERAGLPWVTFGYADSITERGFKYVVDTNATSSQQAALALPALMDVAERATGQKLKTVAIVGDNTAPAKAFLDPLRQGKLAEYGITILSDQTYTPPIPDATSLVQAIRAGGLPDFIMFYCSNPGDGTQFIQKLHEFGLSQTRVPLFAPSATHLCLPAILETVSADQMEGMIASVASWPSAKRQGDLIENLRARSGLDWLIADVMSQYADLWLIADAIERAGSTDRDKIMAELHATDTSEGPAKYYLGGHLKFDEKGRRLDAPVVMLQWRDGRPVPVFPEADAEMEIFWPKA